jgi:four helix bundle protein
MADSATSGAAFVRRNLNRELLTSRIIAAIATAAGLHQLPVMIDKQLSPQRLRTLALQRRSFELTCAIIKSYPKRPYPDDASREIWRQLIKAVSSSTFNLEEADGASSDQDFLAKMRIATREAKETHVAIRIIVRCELANFQNVAQYQDEANQIAAIFATIVRNKKANMLRAKAAGS